jgi:ATP-dependent protease ClpP protease subunit
MTDETQGEGVADGGDDAENVIDQSVPEVTKTPFFQACHAERYQRQAVIKTIQDMTGRQVICYISGDNCQIDRNDVVPFVDLLHNIEPNKPLDIVLHTGGGDIDAAEKLITMVRNKCGDAELRAIVPDFAKSAGTLIVLGVDRVVMSDASELGPIDPQIVLADGNGNRIRHSVKSYLDAFDEHTAKLEDDPGNVAAQIMLNKMDPATVNLFRAVYDRSRQFAEEQLKRGMFRNGGNWSRATSELLNNQQWLSHGQPISWQDASARIGLTVDYYEPSNEEWQAYWQLYCLQRLAVRDGQKLYESDYVSLCVDGEQ